MDAVDLWRVGYVLFATALLILVFIELKAQLKIMEKPQIYGALALLGFIFTSIVTALESMYRNQDVALRTPLNTACCLWLALAIWVGRKDRPKKED